MNKNSNTLRRFELILATLLLLIIGVSYVPLSTDSIRQKIIEAVADNSDYRLEISGSFSTYLSLTPGFEATQVRIQEKDLPTIYEIKKLAVNVSLASLIFGDPVISSLSIEGMDVDLKPAVEIADETLDDAATGKFQIPLVKRLVLRDVQLRYGDSGKLLIEDWEFSHALVGGDLELRGQGHINNRSYRLTGALGSVQQLLSSGKAYPIDIRLDYQSASLSLEGTINRPLGAGDLALDLEAGAPDLSTVLKSHDVQAPKLGILKATARLGGSLSEPSVEQLDVKLSKGERFTLEASGAISNLFDMENDVIQVSGHINKDKEFLNWAMPDDLTGVEEWRLQGELITDKKGLRLEGLDVEGVDPAGLTLKLKGGGLLENFDTQQPFSRLDVMANIESENTAAARPLLIDALPEMGPVQGTFRIVAASDEAIAFEDINATVGSGKDARLIVKGRVANAPLAPDEPNTGNDIRLELSATHSEKLAKLFETELPPIAPVKIKGRFTGSRLKSTLKEISLTAGKSKGVMLGVKGNIEFDDFSKDEYLKDINLKIDFSSPDTAMLATFIEQELPELGQTGGNFMLRGTLKNLQAKDISLSFGTSDDLQLQASGEVRKVRLEPDFKLSGIRMNLNAMAPSTDKLSTWLDFKVPDLGQLQGKAQILDQDGSLGLEDAQVSVGPADKPIISAQGKIGDIRKVKNVEWQIHMDIGTDDSLERMLGYPIPDLGMLHGDMEVSDGDGSLGIEKIEMTSDREDLLKVNISGLFDDLNNTDEMDVKAEVSTKSLEVVGLLFGQAWPESKPANFTGSIRITKDKAAIDGKLVVGKTEIIADIDGVRIKPRPSIKGKIATDVIYLSDFGFPETEEEIKAIADEQEAKEQPKEAVKTTATKDRLFSQEPISLGWMQDIDLDLKIQAGDIIGTGAKMDSFVIPVQIKNGGVLLVSPATFVYDEGVVLMDYRLSALNKPPTASFKMTADDISVGRSLAHVGAQVPVDGSLNINIDLSTIGQSKADMAANLNGVIELGMENMKLPSVLIDLLGVDLFGWVLSSTVRRGHEARLDCGILRMKADKGLLTTELFFLDGATLTVSGEGRIDLAKETIDFSIYPKRKRRFWAKVTPVNVSGPLTSPTGSPIVGAAMGTAAATGYAGLALAPQVAIPVTALGYLSDLFSKDDSKGDKSACLKFVEKEN